MKGFFSVFLSEHFSLYKEKKLINVDRELAALYNDD